MQGWGGGAAHLHVTDELTSQQLCRVELMRKPLREILADRVAL